MLPGIRNGLGVIAAALVSTLGLPFAVVAPAEAASGPTYTVQSITRTFNTSVATYTFTYQKPVVGGVSAAVAASVDNKVDAFFASAVEWRTVGDLDCADTEEIPTNLSGDTQGGLFRGRYLSVHLSWDVASCYDYRLPLANRWLNIDLTTGKSVKLSALVANPGGVRNQAIDDRLEAANQLEWWQAKDLAGWTISNSGLKAYFTWEGEASGYLVPWKNLVKPDWKSKRVTVTKNVKRYINGDLSGRATVSVQGNVVKVDGRILTYRGVRRDAYSVNRDLGAGLGVRFAKSTSAVAKFVSAFC